ncbi:MAG: hypothetical protein WCT29_00740 [Candidatus Paceibacterota bacterium]|jgi:hypothetical protein
MGSEPELASGLPSPASLDFYIKYDVNCSFAKLKIGVFAPPSIQATFDNIVEALFVL